MENTENIKLLKESNDRQKAICYKRITNYLNELSLVSNKYSNLCAPRNRTKLSNRFIIVPSEFDKVFENNNFNFLDMMYLLTIAGSSQNSGIFNFLLSNDIIFSAKGKYKLEYIDFFKLKIDKSNDDTDIIKKRQLFVLAFLNLVLDYFNTYSLNKNNNEIENKIILNEYEQLVVNLFNNIFSIERDEFSTQNLIESFKRMKNAHFNLGLKYKEHSLFRYINNIFTKTEEINDKIIIVKKQILDYYLFYDNKEKYQNWIIDFLNSCSTEIINYNLIIVQPNINFIQEKQLEKTIKQKEIEIGENIEKQGYDNLWINCDDGICYSLDYFINTKFNNNKEQFFYELGYMFANCWNGAITPFCDNNNNPLMPNVVFIKLQENNADYINKFNSGIELYYNQYITELQNQYNFLIQVTNQFIQIDSIQNSNQIKQNNVDIIQQISQNINEAVIEMVNNIQNIEQNK